jgi:hypothetical protein
MKRHNEIKPGWVLLVGFIALGIVGNFQYREQLELERISKQPPALTAEETRLAEFFVENGSTHPVELAKVVVKTKRPRLAAAQAVVESNGRKDAIGKANEKGVWQIIESEWGIVPEDLSGQAYQWEKIMEGLLNERGNLRQALSAYNGDFSGDYYRKVMKKVNEVPI